MEEIRFEYDCDVSVPHYHNEMEILYVLSGRIGVILAGSNYLLKQEDFSVFNPFEIHEMYRETGCHTISAFIPIHMLQHCELGSIFCCSAMQLEQEMYLNLFRTKLAMIYKDYLKGERSRRLYILSNIYDLLAILKQQFEVLPYDAVKGGMHTADRMQQVLMYIHAHYTENISLQQVAEKTYMSAGHLSRQFEKQIGIHFSEYLRKLRLNKAAGLLSRSDKTVNEIAEECGFFNVNTFTSNFKAFYGDIPSGYRKKKANVKHTQAWKKEEPANAIRLLKYASGEEGLLSLNKERLPITKVEVEIDGRNENGNAGRCRKLSLSHNVAINCGYAKDYFVEGHQEALKQSVQEIGFRYIFLQGILDDNMNVYHEHLDGTPWFNFTYLDAILDHICSMGVTPWLELSHTPERMVDQKKMIFNDGYIQLPSDLQKWEHLIENVLEHLIVRYGKENVEKWRFSMFPALFIFYGIFSIEEYLEYYQCTWKAVKRKLPDVAIISGAFDSGCLIFEGEEMLSRFLRYCQEYQCMPNEIGLQDFAIDYSRFPKKGIEERILEGIRYKKAKEPAPPGNNPDILRDHISFVKNILRANHVENLPICMVYCSSTMWSQDLGNDTCYKSAFLVKNYLENAGSVTMMNMNILMDLPDDINDISSPYYGNLGDMNYLGIPKAAYYARVLLSRLFIHQLAQGDGFVVTCSEDQNDIRILLYHYCHYDLEMHLDSVLPREEQLTIDRYCGFLDPGVRSFRIDVKGLKEGIYDEEIYAINRETGSSYDVWQKMGAPQIIHEEQKEYLIQMSKPGYYYKKRKICAGENMILSAVLDSHEVRLICLTRQMHQH